jgi:hypothetical protein
MNTPASGSAAAPPGGNADCASASATICFAWISQTRSNGNRWPIGKKSQSGTIVNRILQRRGLGNSNFVHLILPKSSWAIIPEGQGAFEDSNRRRTDPGRSQPTDYAVALRSEPHHERARWLA